MADIIGDVVSKLKQGASEIGAVARGVVPEAKATIKGAAPRVAAEARGEIPHQVAKAKGMSPAKTVGEAGYGLARGKGFVNEKAAELRPAIKTLSNTIQKKSF